MEKKMISIIVPVYNVEKYLPACLDSICHQTLKELEIILVDDGSTDNSGRIAEQYALQDKRIRVVHQRNGNPGATRNVGLELATGEYIGFVDSDDWIEPEMYKKMYDSMVSNGSELVVCGVSVEYTHEKRYIQQQVEKDYTEYEPEHLLDLFFSLKKRNLFAYPVNKLYRTSILRKYQLQFPDILPYEDLIFNLNYYMKIESVSLVEDMFYHYLRRDEISAAGAYSPSHLYACSMAESTFRQFFSVYKWNDIEMESYLCSRRVTDYLAYASGFYKKNCPLTRNERIDLLKKDFLKNPTLKRDILLAPPTGFYQKMFYFFLFSTTPLITDSYYHFLFYMRYRFDGVYRKFRQILFA